MDIGRTADERGDAWQQYQHRDGEQVLDDEPADGDPALDRVELAPFDDRPQHDHRAGHGDSQTEDEAADQALAQEHAHGCPGDGDDDARTRPPGTAIARTSRRSRTEKWMPTPNMSRMTPILASSVAIAASAT